MKKIKLSSVLAPIVFGVSLSASTVTVSNTNTAGVSLANGESLEVTSTGNITNQVDATGITIGSITVDGTINHSTDDALRIADSSTTGDIVINGSVETTDTGSRAVVIVNTGVNTIQIDGDILNTGTIEGDNDGLALIGSNSSTQRVVLTGTLRNDGTIIGYNQDGIDIDDGVTIQGGIINTGTILGMDGEGIEIDEEATIQGGILNTGTIKGYDSAIEIDNANSGSTIATTITGNIKNSSTGLMEGTYGIFIRNVQISNNNLSTTINGNIINEGRIETTNNAIEISDESIVTGNITNSGTIKTTSGNTISILNGASLIGDITNSGTINSSGKFIDLNTGSLSNSSITGDIINTSTGIITGNSALIKLNSDQTFTGDIINYGSMTTSRDNVVYTRKVVGNVINYGTMISTDTNDPTIQLWSGSFSGDLKNYGTISGQDESLKISSDLTNLDIYNYENAKIMGTLNIAASNSFENSGIVYLKKAVSVSNADNTGTSDSSVMTGNYTQTSTGELNFAVNDNSSAGSTYSNFSITGNAAFSDNAKLSIDIKNSGANINNNDVFQNIVSATGTLTTSTFDISDNSLEWSFNAVNDGSGGLDITASSTGITTIKNAVMTTTKGAGDELDNFTDEDVNNALFSLNSTTEVQDAVNQTLPTLAGEASTVTFNNVKSVNNIIQARLEGNSGLSSGDNFFTKGHAWAKPFGSLANQDDVNGVSGYKSNTYGIVFGEDKELNGSDRVGIAVSYVRSNTKNNTGLQESDVDMFQVIGYGSRQLTQDIEMNFQSDMSYTNTSGTRTIDFGGLNKTALSSYDSYGFHVGGGISKLYKIDSVYDISATIRGDYTYVKDDGYSETGADALNLTVNSNSASQLIAYTGTKLVKKVDDNTKITANIGIGYDFHAKQNSVTASYAGNSSSSFITTGIDTKPWLVKAGVGAVKDHNGVEFTANYDVEARDYFTNQTVSLKARWAF